VSEEVWDSSFLSVSCSFLSRLISGDCAWWIGVFSLHCCEGGDGNTKERENVGGMEL